MITIHKTQKMSSYFPQTSSSLHRRTPHVQTATTTPSPTQLQGADPAPTTRPIAQFLALAAILLLAFLQFLPATHFRDPSDPFRKWVSFGSNHNPLSSSFSNSEQSGNGESSSVTANGREDGTVNIVSWMDQLNLPVLAVVVNSSLSSSRFPDQVYFHFFIPGGQEDKVSYYKLKVLFPNANLEIHGQEEVKDMIGTRSSGEQYGGRSFEAIVPFVIPTALQSLSKFIYVSPNVIVKGRVEEFIKFELSSHAVAAAEDCSKRLNSYVNSDVLGAIQRSASKPWVSDTPYDKNTCMLDLSILLIDAKKLRRDFIEAVLWWNKVLDLSERGDSDKPAIALALHDRYFKLSTGPDRESTSPEINIERMVVLYDAPKNVCSRFGSGVMPQLDHGDIWTQYLPPMADRILGC